MLQTSSGSPDLEALLTWYGQFSHDGLVDWTVASPNAFWKVPLAEIEKCEQATRVPFPPYYKEFLLRVGEGRFLLGAEETKECGCKNTFLGPQDIEGILLRKSECWQVYPDEYIYPGEFPFFDIGSCGVFVFSEKSGPFGRVFSPGGFEPECADSFVNFLSRLKENTSFYISSEV
jgi:hypothetical protein